MLKFTVALAAALVIVCVAALASANAIKDVPALQQRQGEIEASTSDTVWAQVCSAFGSTTAAAGVMGNIAIETGNTYNYAIKQKGGNGYGLFQFDFLKKYYFAWLTKKGRTDSSQSQVTFVYETIYGAETALIGAGTAKKVKAGLAQSTAAATAGSFCDDWEKPGVPHRDQRISAAKTWAAKGCPKK